MPSAYTPCMNVPIQGRIEKNQEPQGEGLLIEGRGKERKLVGLVLRIIGKKLFKRCFINF